MTRLKESSQQVDHIQVLNWTGPGGQRSKLPLLASHTSDQSQVSVELVNACLQHTGNRIMRVNGGQGLYPHTLCGGTSPVPHLPSLYECLCYSTASKKKNPKVCFP